LRIFVEDTVLLGGPGFEVPAIAFQPSPIISTANCLASAAAPGI